MKRGLEDMNSALPMELQLDLLVDGELSDADRRRLLSQLEREAVGAPGPWRDLAIRKRRTEVDAQLGPAVEIGRRHGLALPITARMARVCFISIVLTQES